MNLTGLLPLLAADPGFTAATERVGERGMLTVTASAGVRPALVAAASERRPIVVVTASGRDAEQAAGAIRSYLPAYPHAVAVFPAWETLPHERLSPRPDTVATRLAVLRRLAHPDASDPRTAAPRVIVIPVRALLQPFARGLGDLEPVAVRVGDTVDMEELAASLVAAAYTRVDMVERRGEFAVRGGLLDVFPPTDPFPSRIEFFGDEVEEIRTFSVADQRSLEASDRVWAPPARELLLTDEVRERARALQPQLPGAADMLERVSQGIAVEGMEALTPALMDGMESVLDLVPDDALVMLADPERIRRRAEDLNATTQEFLAAAWT
ncbi:MAG: transcription-repair coupling factor, partial [bacterium]|nr:transcription-repair coupling factor [bacterium]